MVVARYASVRAGLASMLDDSPDVQICGDVSGSADLEAELRSGPIDVVLYDVDSADLREILRICAANDLGLVALDSSTEGVQNLLGAAVRGWALLPKEAEREEIVSALHGAASGLIVLDRAFAQSAIRPPLVAAGGTMAETEALTGREREILQLMAEGLANKQIGAKLGISLHTVKFHVASILSKLGVQSRTEAVTLGVRQGLVLL